MFLRISKGKTKDYIVVVSGYRDRDGRSRQKTVKNLGSFKTEEEKKRLLEFGKKFIAKESGHGLFTASDIVEKKRENWGAGLIVSKLFSEFGLRKYLDKLTAGRKLEYDLKACLEFLITARFLEPASKLRSFSTKEKFAGFPEFELQHLYRSLDELCYYREELSSHLFAMQKKFSKEKIDLVLFDVTTMFFESQKADDLRDFGFSKDHKFGEVQLMLSLMINSDDRPLGYELFPGNTYEGHTLLPCLLKLKEKYNIGEVIIVADRGINALDNLKAIRDQGFHYIVATKVGAYNHARRKQVLEPSSYQTLFQDEEEFVKYKIIEEERIMRKKPGEKEREKITDRIICFYSSKRAKKDAKDRERLVVKANELLNSGALKNKKGAEKYVLKESSKLVGLNIEKIRQDAEVDGFYAISYSRENMRAEDIIGAYRNLWKIEDSFRTMKSFFDTRPIFHWTARRIEGHIMLNFIALIFEKHIELLVKDKTKTEMTQRTVRDAMSGMQRSLMEGGGHMFYSYSNLDPSATLLLSAIGITKPANH